MGMVEGALLGVPFPDSIQIPRRKRSCSAESKCEDEASMSVWEAATILMAMANGNGAFYKQEDDKKKNPKRKKCEKQTETQTQRKKRRKEISLSYSPEMPAAMRDRIGEMGGYQIQLVIEKQLQDTDLNKNHGRLSLPAKKLRVDFTTEEERMVLDQQDHKNKKGMEVLIMDPLLRESCICLKKWKIGSCQVYCLMTNWNSFVEETGLASGDFIQLWCFRKDYFDPQIQTLVSRPCFAMVKLDISQCL